MKKWLICGSILVLLTLTLSACKSKTVDLKPEEVSEDTILLKNDGTLQSVQVGDFDKDYYEESELRAFVESTLEIYNAAAGNERVTLVGASAADGVAKLIYSFMSIESYADFNAIEAAVYTAEEAGTAEGLPEQFFNTKGEAVSAAEALESTKNEVLMVTGAQQVELPGKVVYYSNAELVNSRLVRTKEEGASFIVYKK